MRGVREERKLEGRKGGRKEIEQVYHRGGQDRKMIHNAIVIQQFGTLRQKRLTQNNSVPSPPFHVWFIPVQRAQGHSDGRSSGLFTFIPTNALPTLCT